MNIILKNTSEKDKEMANEIISSFLELLKELTLLEEEIFKRNHEMDVEKSALNISDNQNHPKWKELMAEYKNRFEEIIKGKVSENLMSRGYAERYANPSEYSYVNSGDFSLEFTIKKEDKVTIITRYKETVDMKHEFILRLIDKKWLVDGKCYGFGDETIWYWDRI